VSAVPGVGSVGGLQRAMPDPLGLDLSKVLATRLIQMVLDLIIAAERVNKW
jgi:hypothetical protein